MPQGKQPNFPGLREKIQRLLDENLTENEQYASKDLQQIISDNSERYEISYAEMQDILKNWGNYARNAKDAGILRGLGRTRGYTTGDSFGVEVANNSSPASESDAAERNNWEAFLHFPATLVLSRLYKARVYSLPQHAVKLKWANPDMLLIRHSVTHSGSVDGERIAKLIQHVDATPPTILTSVELKYSIEKNRSLFLSALSETAVNGSWANENLLVYFEDTPYYPEQIDPDALAFARANGVGVVRIQCVGDTESELEESFLPVIVVSPTRSASLHLEHGLSLENPKQGLVVQMAAAIETFLSEGSFMDIDGNNAKLAGLLLQADDNLRKQPLFRDNGVTAGVATGTQEKQTRYLMKVKQYLPSILEGDLASETLAQLFEKDEPLAEWPHVERKRLLRVAKFLDGLS